MIAPETTGCEDVERDQGIVQLVTCTILAAASALIFLSNWRRAAGWRTSAQDLDAG